MKPKLILAVLPVLGLLLASPLVHAELLLTGNTAGFFQPSANPYTTVVNSPDGSSASFRTGVPVGGSFKSGVRFNGSDFADIGNGDTFAFGALTYYNGITRIGTSSGTALLDFYLDLEDPAYGPLLLTTVTFGIDATVNTPPNLVPDIFTASFTQPAPVMIGDQWVKFKINGLPSFTEVKEDTWVDLGSVTVTYLSPVPEPATYGLIGALSLVGVAAIRRVRRKVRVPVALPTA